MDRTGLTDAQVLVALYKHAVTQGMGFLQSKDGDLTVADAEKLLKGTRNEPGQPRTGNYFDYLYGRVIKTDVSKNPLNLRLYDRDNGEGAGKIAILALLEELTRP